MHAAVVRANVPGGPNEARLQNLRERVVPRVSSQPGFIAGYWTEVRDGLGLSFHVFEDEASAKAGVPAPGADMGEGVTIASVEFREVVANA
jgi:hypothetical protein